MRKLACLGLVGFAALWTSAPAEAASASDIFNAIANGVSTAVNTGANITKPILSAVGGSANSTGQAVVSDIQTGTQQASNTLVGLAPVAVQLIQTPGAFVAAIVPQAIANIEAGLGPAVAAASQAGRDVVNTAQSLLSNATSLVGLLGAPLAADVEAIMGKGQRHPLVIFPDAPLSRLQVNVSRGSPLGSCPASTSFQTTLGEPAQTYNVNQSCVLPYLTLQYDPSVASLSARFSNQPGVNVSLPDFGQPLCAPYYQPLYYLLQLVGYTPGRDLLTACYDWRLAPDTSLGGAPSQVAQAKALVQQAYSARNRTAVYLAAHGDGAMYALALLASQTSAWRNQYVAGLISWGGNYGGRGLNYAQLFSGQSLLDSSFDPSTATAWASFPSTYLGAAAPEVIGGDHPVIVDAASGRNYTPADYPQLFQDARMQLASQLGSLYIGNLSGTAPQTNFIGFAGTGVNTTAGVTLPGLNQSLPISGRAITVIGDGSQSDLSSFDVTQLHSLQPECYTFNMTNSTGSSALSLPLQPGVVRDTINALYTTPPDCSAAA